MINKFPAAYRNNWPITIQIETIVQVVKHLKCVRDFLQWLDFFALMPTNPNLWIWVRRQVIKNGWCERIAKYNNNEKLHYLTIGWNYIHDFVFMSVGNAMGDWKLNLNNRQIYDLANSSVWMEEYFMWFHNKSHHFKTKSTSFFFSNWWHCLKCDGIIKYFKRWRDFMLKRFQVNWIIFGIVSPKRWQHSNFMSERWWMRPKGLFVILK